MRDVMLVDLVRVGLVISLGGCGGEEPTVRGVGTEAQASVEGAACEHREEHREEHVEAVSTGPQPSAVLADGSRQFGGALTELAPTALSAISASPTSFDGQTVRTEGTIERVCQRMGCWMELRAEGTEPIRVPMAGHSLFLPRDVEGHVATIEGRVQLTPLSPERRAHLESEGALATAGDLSIEATSVVVR